VEQYADSTNKNLLILDDYILDVTSFAPHHPGGALLVRQSNLKNVEEEMKFHHPLTLHMATTMAIGSFKKDIQRII
jgi:cytochrome b involved in lipid metabolism